MNVTQSLGGMHAAKVITVFVVCALAAMAATAQDLPARIVAFQPPGPADVDGCPDQGGILDSVTVPVNQPLELSVVIGSPAPEGGARFQTSSDDPAIVAAGDRQQGFLPEVFIPAGETTSNPFTIFGIAVGETRLRLIALTPGFFGGTFPLGAWDVLDQGLTDANPASNSCRAEDSVEFSTDEQFLAECGRQVVGVAADGVSHLAFRLQGGLEGTACFEVLSGDPADGTLSAELLTTSAIDGNLDQATSFYRAPLAYGEDSETRNVMVEFTFTPSIGNGNTTRAQYEIQLAHPPAVLLHGLWADAGSWRGFWFDRNTANRTVVAPNYAATNGGRYAGNAPRVQGFVSQAISDFRRKGYATTQADIVGHSMGGILSRLYTQESTYRRPENLDEGDLHRIVTLATPHLGSAFPNLITALHDARPAETVDAIQNVVGAQNNINEGAICDLAENSPGLAAVGGTGVKSHVVTATGAPAGTDANPGEFWSFSFVGPSFERELTRTECIERTNRGCRERAPVFDQTVVDAFRFRQQNDAIVPLTSQLGGLAQGGQSSRNFANLLHFGTTVLGIRAVSGVTNSREVTDHVFDLFNQPDDTPTFADSLPGTGSSGSGNPVTVPGQGGGVDGMIYASQCVGGPLGNPIRWVKSLFTSQDSRVRVISPAPGAVFNPGDEVTVLVQVEAPLLPNDITVRIPDFGLNLDGEFFEEDGTYDVTFTIPEAAVGAFDVIPQVTDENLARVRGETYRLQVSTVDSPERLLLPQSSFFLDVDGETQGQLTVLGIFTGDTTRILTSAATGTVYESANPAVVTVSEDGALTAVGGGDAVVTIRNGDASAFALVNVASDEPIVPTDVSASVSLRASGIRLDRESGFFVQQLTVRNNQSVPVIGPLFLAIANLTPEVSLIGADGRSRNLSPVGSPYYRLPLDDGLVLAPDESKRFILRFLNADRVQIEYDAILYSTTDSP